MQSKKLTMARLLKEEASLEKEPLSNALVTRKDFLNFHFCLYNLEGPYSGGFYHGRLELHENYPFAAPKLIFYTPSGRFDINLPICTSFTNYHQQSWTSAWNVRTLILATISFIYGCRQDPNQTRIKMAKASLNFNLQNKQFVELFGEKLKSIGVALREEPSKEHKQNYVQYIQDKKSVIDENDIEIGEEIEVDLEEKPLGRNNNQRLRPIIKILGICVLTGAIVGFVIWKCQ